jgi:hypothetical protein
MAYSAPSPIVVTGSRGQAPITVEDIAALNMPADPNPVQVQSAVCLVYAIE